MSEAPSANILVTGATGRLGGHVVRALRRIGASVRALVRRGSEYYWLNDTGCSYFFADLKDFPGVERALRGITHVIVCSGVDHETRANNHTTLTVRAHEHLFRAAAASGVQRVVYVSALGVDRGYPIPWFDAKLQAEQALVDSGAEWTILRPAPFTHTFAGWARQALRRPLWLPGAGRNLVAPLYSGDLAVFAVGCLDSEVTGERIIELCGPESCTPRDLLRRAERPGDEPRIIWMPGSLASAAARLSRGLGRRWEHRLLHHRAWLSEPFVAETEGWWKALDMTPRGVNAALRADLDELVPREDPGARSHLVVHRRFEADVARAGSSRLADLPRGPLRYD